MKKAKFDIIKTFEVFNMESLCVLKDKFVEIIMLETENIFSKSTNLFNVDFKKDDSVQITIINDKGTFDLLSNTWKRHLVSREKQKITGERLRLSNKSQNNIKKIGNEENNKSRVPHQLNVS